MKPILKYAALLLVLCSAAGLVAATQNGEENGEIVRLAVVITPHYSGLIDFLVEDFHRNSGIRVEVTSSNDVFKRARDGKADIVISHYGKEEVEAFVLEGYGTWPRMVFSNQAALIGPASDPAGIKGFTDAATAFRRIAETGAPFIVNSISTMKYLEDLLWASAGHPARKDWYVDTGTEKEEAARLAEEKQGYFLWGAYPFLRYKNGGSSSLEIVVSADPIFQRVMSAIVVNPNKIQSVNSGGAQLFLDYILKPETQAKIVAFRSAGIEEQLWWPGGHDN